MKSISRSAQQENESDRINLFEDMDVLRGSKLSVEVIRPAISRCFNRRSDERLDHLLIRKVSFALGIIDTNWES